MSTSTRSTHSARWAVFSSTVLLICFSVTLPTISFPVHGHRAFAPVPGRVALQWETNVGGRRALGARRGNGVRLVYTSIGFSGEGVLIASFATPESKARFSPRRVHCAVLDTQTGRILNEREWSVLANRVGVFATGGGDFVVRTNSGLALYSSRLELLAEFPMPTSTPGSGLWRVSLTPTGRSIVVLHHPAPFKTKIQWLNSRDLVPLRSWEPKEQDWYNLAFSDSEVARVLPWGVQVGPPDGPWETSYGSPAMGQSGLGADFATDHALLVCRASSVSVVRTNGQFLLARALRDHEYCQNAAARSSADGRRLMIPTFVTRGGSQLFDIPAHKVLKRILIYDLPDKRLAIELDGGNLSLKDVSAFALSPKGSRLALMRDGTVKLYRLPR